MDKIITFIENGEEYGFCVEYVCEVLRLNDLEVSPVPGAPDCIYGVTKIREDILSVINANKLLGLPPTEISADTRIIILECPEDGTKFGFSADEVKEIHNIQDAEIQDIEKKSQFFKGVTLINDRLISLLDARIVIDYFLDDEFNDEFIS